MKGASLTEKTGGMMVRMMSVETMASSLAEKMAEMLDVRLAEETAEMMVTMLDWSSVVICRRKLESIYLVLPLC